MPYIPTTPKEIIPAKPARLANFYRIRKLSLDMGSHDCSIDPVFTILIANGNLQKGVFTPISREEFEITDPDAIAKMMSTSQLRGETLSQTTERAAFDYLISNGFVPSGSIEI